MAHDPINSCRDTESWNRSLRLTLLRGEALRVPRGARRLRVLSGTAWVSLEGEDFVLERCESIPLAKRPGHEAVVSATGRDPLLFELDRALGRLMLV
jgi:hypothetical protein